MVALLAQRGWGNNMGRFHEEVERFWISPDGTEFLVEYDHAHWIRTNKTILDKYEVKDRTRRGLMKEGWIRIKKGQHRFREAREFDYIEIQTNLRNRNACVLAQKYASNIHNMEILIGNYDESFGGRFSSGNSKALKAFFATLLKKAK